MWGAGCIMAEMWTRVPILQGNTEQHQLTLIAQLCGNITPDVWEGVDKLELYNKMDIPKGKRRVKERLRPYLKDLSACDLIDKLLTLDPSKRLNADESLNHDFFWTEPVRVSDSAWTPSWRPPSRHAGCGSGQPAEAQPHRGVHGPGLLEPQRRRVLGGC